MKFKQKCVLCKKNYVIVGRRDNFPKCYDCQKTELTGQIRDPKFKKMFDIPEKFYMENLFLRNIKISYLLYRKLSEKQIEYFNKTVDEMKANSK